MKRFFVLLLVVFVSCNAWGKKTLIKKEPLKDKDTTVVTLELVPGNNNACFVLKPSVADGTPSTFYFCGKKSNTSGKCASVSPASSDTKMEYVSGDSFLHLKNKYYCCDGDASKTGTFKIYQDPTESQEKNEISGTNGGWCYQTVSVDVCGTKTITKPCKVPTECPSGKEIHNKKCLSCPSGQHFKSDTSDECEPDKLNCSDTQEEHNGQCVDKCTGGKHFESATSNKCVCSSGMVEISGVCETKKTCSDNEDYIAATNTCKAKEVEQQGGNNNGDGDTPLAEVTYEFLFNDAKSCYVKKPSDNSDVELFWCGKPSTNKCGDYKQSDVGVWSEIDDGDAGTKDNYCCCGGTESKAGEFRKCTESGTRTKIKKVVGGVCEYTVNVDSCNRETIIKDCNTPDSTLSVSGKTPVTKSNMQECGLCTNKKDFKTCMLNSCYESDANVKLCTEKLKKACLIKK